MRRSLACLSLILGICSLPAWSAPSNYRLESIKQHALALHTVSLADKRHLADDAIVLLDFRTLDAKPEQLRIWLNQKLWTDLKFPVYEASLLSEGGTKFLGIAPLSAGQHDVQIQFNLRLADGTLQQLNGRAQLTLDQWPRGITIRLNPPAKRNGKLKLSILQAAGGDEFLAAARHAKTMGFTGAALTMLQTLSEVDPKTTHTPEYILLMGEALQAWNLNSAAEGMFGRLINHSDDAEARAVARLKAAEIGIAQQHLDATARYLNLPDKEWPKQYKDQADVLKSRLLVSQSQTYEASKKLPEDAPLLWLYNLAAALLASSQEAHAVTLLNQIGKSEKTEPGEQHVRDLANLRLGYLLLQQNRAQEAFESFQRVPAGSSVKERALLGQGWAALAQFRPPRFRSSKADDGMRPQFIQRIDEAVNSVAEDDKQGQNQLRKALLTAVESWTQLRNANPLEPAVQEALVAIPYALALLGADQRAMAYGEVAIQRLTAVREGLSKVYMQTIKSNSVEAAELAAAIWPPRPGAWSELAGAEDWWLNQQAQAPKNFYLKQFLSEAETLSILHSMQVLSEAQTVVAAASESPNLNLRAQQLLRRIDAEREVQQRALNRFTWSWLDQRGILATRYLIMARLIVGQVQQRQLN